MFGRFQTQNPNTRIGLVILLFVGITAPATAAGVVGYRNDTPGVVSVQSTVAINGAVRRGKPQLLYPGEIALDPLPAPGVRRIVVSDPKRPNQVLFQNDLNIADDVVFSIQPDTPLATGKGPPQPRVKLVPVRLPATPARPNNPPAGKGPPASKPPAAD
jgi:hypothetical protein